MQALRNNIKATPALIFLLLVNLIPVLGVWLLSWDIATIIVLYWLETVIIGLVNIPKMWACEGGVGTKVFITLFFLFHFGMFSWGHLTFLIQMFDAGRIIGGLRDGGPVVWTAASLLISHLFSMIVNFFGQKEYKGRAVNTQMFFPYGRIVVMHIVIIFGGVLVMSFGAPVLALLLLIGLKIIMDMTAHSLEHSGKPMHMMK